jgi:VanZ family protein
MILYLRKYFILSWLWLIIVTILSTLPGPYFPKINILNFDKAVHLFMYFAFVSVLLWSMYFNSWKHPNIKAFLIATIYSIIMEIVQGTICIRRSFDIYDIIANTIGALMATLLIKYYLKSFYPFTIK